MSFRESCVFVFEIIRTDLFLSFHANTLLPARFDLASHCKQPWRICANFSRQLPSPSHVQHNNLSPLMMLLIHCHVPAFRNLPWTSLQPKTQVTQIVKVIPIASFFGESKSTNNIGIQWAMVWYERNVLLVCWKATSCSGSNQKKPASVLNWCRTVAKSWDYWRFLRHRQS